MRSVHCCGSEQSMGASGHGVNRCPAVPSKTGLLVVSGKNWIRRIEIKCEMIKSDGSLTRYKTGKLMKIKKLELTETPAISWVLSLTKEKFSEKHRLKRT